MTKDQKLEIAETLGKIDTTRIHNKSAVKPVYPYFPLDLVQIEVVNICNYRCPLCATLKRDGVIRSKMAFDDFTNIIDEIGSTVKDLPLFGSRGEPFLHADYERMVAYARKNTSARISSSTNGSLLTKDRAYSVVDSGLDSIIFGIDGLEQESYSQYRVGGKLDKVLKNLKDLISVKEELKSQTPEVIFQFIPMATNEHEIELVSNFASDLGVDQIRIKHSSSVALSEKFRTRGGSYENQLNIQRLEDSSFICPWHMRQLYIDPNCDVYVCCITEGDAEFNLGNTKNIPIAEMWDKESVWKLRKSFAKQTDFHPRCLNVCRSKLKNQNQVLPNSTQ